MDASFPCNHLLLQSIYVYCIDLQPWSDPSFTGTNLCQSVETQIFSSVYLTNGNRGLNSRINGQKVPVVKETLNCLCISVLWKPNRKDENGFWKAVVKEKQMLHETLTANANVIGEATETWRPALYCAKQTLDRI